MRIVRDSILVPALVSGKVLATSEKKQIVRLLQRRERFLRWFRPALINGMGQRAVCLLFDGIPLSVLEQVLFENLKSLKTHDPVVENYGRIKTGSTNWNLECIREGHTSGRGKSVYFIFPYSRSIFSKYFPFFLSFFLFFVLPRFPFFALSPLSLPPLSCLFLSLFLF
jgi:hypothetical protein